MATTYRNTVMNLWYDQAGAFELTFAENGQPENTKTYTVVANNITLKDWYRTWLEANEKL